MHDDPRPDQSDAGDLTQRHPITPSDPAATPLTPSSTSPADAASSGGEAASPAGSQPADRFTPAPEPRAAWARSYDGTPPVTPERWYEPAPTPAATAVTSPARMTAPLGS